MGDIYVRSYDSGHKRSKKGWILLILFIIVIAATWWWLRDSSSEQTENDATDKSAEKTEAVEVSSKDTSTATTTTTAAKQEASDSAALVDNTGHDQSSVEMEAVATDSTADAKFIKNAGELNLQLRSQGQASFKRIFSDANDDWVTSYVIQPGDSLDRIARKKKTTIDLIRKMNNLEGNLIHPGQRLRIVSEPFVVYVDKSDRMLTLALKGEVFKRYIVGVGRYGKTPVGTFKTVVHQTNPDWTRPGGGIVPFGDPENVLGTRWMSIEDKTRPELRGFGIHGTTIRDSIGGETSNGCIRMLNEDVEEVFYLIPRGTKVIISE